MENRWGFPDLGLGLGLRSPHVVDILDRNPPVGFFEILTENYLDTAGPRRELLEEIAAHYPVVLHGVSMSIGSTDPLDRRYLGKVRELADSCRARWVSDHLCWTGVGGVNSHDLLPLPYTEAVLRHVAGRVREASDLLGRPLVLENPSSYLAFTESSLSESEFLARLCEEADCGLLLDINNVYVSARNHGFDPEAYLDDIPADRVVQIHLAGHSDRGEYLLDTHSAAVADAVWDLYARWSRKAGAASTLLEWDADIPPFDMAWAEVGKATQYRQEVTHALAA